MITNNYKHHKLDFRLEKALATAQNQDAISLTVIFRTNSLVQVSGQDIIGQNGQPVPGVNVRTNIANEIFTGTASPNGVRALSNEPTVVSIDGARFLL